MTVTKSRAALAAFLLAASALTNAAYAQDRTTSDSTGELAIPGRTTKPQPLGLSQAVARPLSTASTAMAAKKWPDALVAANAAMAEAKTDYEKNKVNQFLMSIDINLGDTAGAVAAASAAADTPPDSISPDDKLVVYRNAAALTLNAKNYAKSAFYAKQLMALNPPDAASQEIILKALYAAGDPGAPALIQKQVSAAVAAGKIPGRDIVAMLMNAQVNAKDEAAAERTLEQSLLWFNDPNDWQQMIDVTISTRGIRDIDALMLGRLLFICGAPVEKEDADLIGQTAQRMALYGDAQLAANKGATLQLDAARVASDKAGLQQQIAMGASQNGLFNVKLGEALYGYGMYPEAEAAARLASSKGGADASEVQMLIGASLAGEGKYADAAAAFDQVKGGSDATPRIARLWSTYAKIKAGVPGAATAAK